MVVSDTLTGRRSAGEVCAAHSRATAGRHTAGLGPGQLRTRPRVGIRTIRRRAGRQSGEWAGCIGTWREHIPAALGVAQTPSQRRRGGRQAPECAGGISARRHNRIAALGVAQTNSKRRRGGRKSDECDGLTIARSDHMQATAGVAESGMRRP